MTHAGGQRPGAFSGNSRCRARSCRGEPMTGSRAEKSTPPSLPQAEAAAAKVAPSRWKR